MPKGIYIRSQENIERAKKLYLFRKEIRKGFKVSEETKKKMSEAKIGYIPWNKGKPYPQMIGNKINVTHGLSHTKEYRSSQRMKRHKLFKQAGHLSIKTVQLIYEDNIKKYGTLTCYLCLNPIPFGKRQDHLEHKTPLSRGGTNQYNNLDIACEECNKKKYNKTEDEFRKRR